jgi:formate-dependent nitrite reductase membrane component NrfD
MMIPLSLASGVWVGSQIVMIMAKAAGGDIIPAEIWSRWALFFYAGSLIVFLWGDLHTSDTSKASIKRILAGDCSVHFYIGTVVLGIIIPLVITLSLWGGDLSSRGMGLFFIRFLCVLVGDAAMRYSIMKAPLYTPLI